MREILDYCTGGIQRKVPAGAVVLQEGTKTGRLFVLIEGRLEVIRGDAVVAVLAEPGAVTGEMSLLLDRPHTATVRAASDSMIYEFNDAASFLSEQPAVLAVNQRFMTYGSPRFDKYLDERKFGPGLSSASLEARKRRFGEGFGETVVGRAMTCTTCHDPHQPLREGAEDARYREICRSCHAADFNTLVARGRAISIW